MNHGHLQILLCKYSIIKFGGVFFVYKLIDFYVYYGRIKSVNK